MPVCLQLTSQLVIERISMPQMHITQKDNAARLVFRVEYSIWALVGDIWFNKLICHASAVISPHFLQHNRMCISACKYVCVKATVSCI